MAKFVFSVSGQTLDLLTPTKGISDTINVNSAEFYFRTPDWDDAVKWAHFSNPDYMDGASVDFELIDDSITPDRGLNLPTGIWEVWLHGEVIENEEVVRRLVTETQTLQIIESKVIGNAPLGELNPSVAEQIDAKATAALNARIINATVDVDNNTGTPYAEVEISGENRMKQLDFHFHNLKGEKGDPGESGIPNGGSTGQVLAKHSATDQDVEWVNAPGGVFFVTIGTTTAREIFTAIAKGNMPVIRHFPDISTSNDVYYLPLVNAQYGSSTIRYYFRSLGGADGYIYSCVLTHNGASVFFGSDSWGSLTNLTYVPGTRTINSKALSSNVTLTAEDIGYNGSALSHTPGSIGEHLSEVDGELIPSGGTTGQILVKRSDADWDVEWADITDLISSMNG